MTYLPNPEHILAKYEFKKPRRLKRLADQTVKDEIIFPQHGGGTGRLEISPSAQTAGKLAAVLQDSNALLPADADKREELLHALRSYVPKKITQFAARSGWTEDLSRFVIQERVIGSSEPGIRGMEPDSDGRPGHLHRAGSVESWKTGVARPAAKSSMLMTCIAAAFGAPLLSIRNEPSFGLCVFGDSRKGKSLGTLCAASLIGLGDETELPTWNLTDAGLESLLPDFQHMLMPVNDIMSMGSSGLARSRDVERIAYKLSGGQARVHQAKYDREVGRAHAPWRSILLTTSETSLVALAGGQRQKGSTIRLIDVPAIVSGDDIFDRMKAGRGTPKRALILERLFTRLFAACKANHGAAFGAYIGNLIRRRDGLKSQCDQHVAAFCERVRRDTDGELTRDLARKVGILFAGAMLARQAEIIDWSEERVLRALSRTYRGARDLLPDDDARDLREGRRNLAVLLRSLPLLGKRHRVDPALIEVDLPSGYRYTDAGAPFAMVRVEKFQSAFASVRQREVVEDWLIANGRVDVAASKSTAHTGPRMKHQHMWPNGNRVRSLLIRRPASTKA